MRTSAQIRSAAWHVPGYASLPKSGHTWKPIHTQKDTSSGNSPMNGHGALALVSVQCCGQANLERSGEQSPILPPPLKPGTSQRLPQVIPIQWLYCDCIVFAFLCFLQLFLRLSPCLSFRIFQAQPPSRSLSETCLSLAEQLPVPANWVRIWGPWTSLNNLLIFLDSFSRI